MKAAFGIFLHDLKRLVSSPFAFAIVLCMIILPSAFAWFSIAAVWSPFQNTDGIRVAVVNEDEGVTVEGLGSVDVGALVADAVKQDGQFAWDVVDSATGEAGLESGDYYAEIILPADFSQQFCSVVKGKAGEPVIGYRVNQKETTVALEVTDAGAGAVDVAIDQAFSKVVSSVTANVTREVSNSIVGAAGSADSRAQANLNGVADRLKEASGGFEEAGKLIDKWRDTVKSSQDSLDGFETTVPDMKSALEKSVELLSDVRTAAHKMSSEYSSDLTKNGPEVVESIEDIVEQVAKAATSMAGVRDKLTDAEEGAREVLDRNQEIIDALESIPNPSEEVQSALEEIKSKTDQLQEVVTQFETIGQDIDSATGGAVDDASNAAEEALKALEDLKGFDDAFNSKILPKFDTSVDSLARLIGSLESSVNGLDAQITQAKSLLKQLDRVFKQTKSVLEQTSESLTLASESLESARTSLTALADSEFVKKAAELSGVDVKTYASFVASPVTTKVEAVYPFNAFGAMLAPFYTNLAIWVGAILLIAVIRLEVDPKLFPGAKSWQAYVGRLLLLVTLSLVQAAIVCAGDLVLGVQAAHPVAFVCSGLMCAFAFVNVVYALALVFKHIGKALAVVLLVVQIPGASGAYPAELLPDAFQGLHQLFPFTYGMGAMAEAIGGFFGNAYLLDMLWLFVFALVVLVLALFVRPGALNLVGLFDDKLRSADVFAVGEYGLGMARRHSLPSIRAMLSNPDTRILAIASARSFERFYGKMRYVVPAAIVLIPVAMIAAMSLIGAEGEGKVFLLLVFLAVVAVLFCAVIALEYVHNSLRGHLVATGVLDASGRKAIKRRPPQQEREMRAPKQDPDAQNAWGVSRNRDAEVRSHRHGKTLADKQQAGRPSTWKPADVGSGRHARKKDGGRR